MTNLNCKHGFGIVAPTLGRKLLERFAGTLVGAAERGVFLAVALVTNLLFLSQPAQASIVVRFDPEETIADPGEVFDVDIVAEIPNPVVGWGLDLTIEDGTVASIAGAPSIGPDWSPVFTGDGDGLAALAFPSSVNGSDVLLATLSLSADAIGQTRLLLSTTPEDLTEGFALDPAGFAEVTFEAGRVTVPEPTTLSLFALVALAATQRRLR